MWDAVTRSEGEAVTHSCNRKAEGGGSGWVAYEFSSVASIFLVK